MKISAADLELFDAIHQGGSITRAAERLGINQSTVSRRLTELEGRLGAPLFVRVREGVHATSIGARWIEPAQASRQALRDARLACLAHAGDEVDAEVTLTSIPSIVDHVLTPRMPALFAAHRRLRLRVLATGDVMDMARLEADIAVRPVRPRAGDLVVRRLIVAPLVPVASAQLAEQLAGTPPSGWPWIALGSARQRPPPVVEWQVAHGVVPRLAVDAGSTQIAALRAALGVGWMAEPMRRSLGLTMMPTTGLPRVEIRLWMTTHRAQRELRHIDAVWRWIEEIFQSPEALG